LVACISTTPSSYLLPSQACYALLQNKLRPQARSYLGNGTGGTCRKFPRSIVTGLPMWQQCYNWSHVLKRLSAPVQHGPRWCNADWPITAYNSLRVSFTDSCIISSLPSKMPKYLARVKHVNSVANPFPLSGDVVSISIAVRRKLQKGAMMQSLNRALNLQYQLNTVSPNSVMLCHNVYLGSVLRTSFSLLLSLATDHPDRPRQSIFT
jgi:hypothetical protein